MVSLSLVDRLNILNSIASTSSVILFEAVKDVTRFVMFKNIEEIKIFFCRYVCLHFIRGQKITVNT